MISISRGWQRCGRNHRSYQLLIMETPRSTPVMILHTNSTDMNKRGSVSNKILSIIRTFYTDMKIKVVSVYNKYESPRIQHLDYQNLILQLRTKFPPKVKTKNPFTWKKAEIKSAFEELRTEIENTKNVKADSFRKEFKNKYKQRSEIFRQEFKNKRTDLGKTYSNAKTKVVGLYVESAPVSLRKLLRLIIRGANKEIENGKIYLRLRKSENLLQQATYQELVAVNEFQRDSTKSIVVCSITMLPFGLLLLAVPIFINPRELLPRSFWTTSQRRVFYGENYMDRIESRRDIMDHIRSQTTNNKLNVCTRSMLTHFNDVFQDLGVLKNKELLAFRLVCREHPFNLKNTENIALVRAFCKVFEVSSFGSVYNLSSRLRRKAIAIRQMDLRLEQMPLAQLTPQEVMDANYLRGMNSPLLSHEANLYWLSNWLKLSSECSNDDVWFILHALVMHSFNYNEVKYKRAVFS